MPNQILYINEYGKRFELPKNYGKCKDRALAFIRFFVDPSHQDAKFMLDQLRMLKRYDPKKSEPYVPHSLAMEMMFWKLAGWASTYAEQYRGFVWGYRHEPTGVAQVDVLASVFDMPEEVCEFYLTGLLDEKLIAWVSLEQCQVMVATKIEILRAGKERPAGDETRNSAGANLPADQTHDAPGIPEDGECAPDADEPGACGQPETDCADIQSRGDRTRDVRPNGDVGDPAKVREVSGECPGSTTTTATATSVSSVSPTENRKRSNGKRPSRQSRRLALRAKQSRPTATDQTKGKASAGKQGGCSVPAAANERPISPTKSEAGSGTVPNSGPLPLRPRLNADGSEPITRQHHYNRGVEIFHALNMGMSAVSEAGKNEIRSFARLFVDFPDNHSLHDFAVVKAKYLARAQAHLPAKARAGTWWKIMKEKTGGK